MTILVKDASVRFGAFHDCFFIVCNVVKDVWSRHAPGIHPVITSANDAKHMLGSLHYQDRGWDFRTFTLPRSTTDLIVKELKELLGPDFDVVLEKDHLHIEYDPPQ